MENLIEEFKRKMYLDGKSERTVEVYSNSVKEFFRWFSDSYGNVEYKKLYRENILEYKSYLKNIKKSLHSGDNLCPKSINSKISELICFNELIQPDDWIDKSVDIEQYFINQEVFKEFLDIIDRFSIGEQMKVILYLLLEKYTEIEIIKYIYKNFPEWEFDRKRLNFKGQHLRFAFIEAGLNTACSKTSICQVVYYDVLEYAVKERIIKRQRAKFLYNGEVIGKGRDEGKTYLEKHPMELSEIMDKMKLKYLCAG